MATCTGAALQRSPGIGSIKPAVRLTRPRYVRVARQRLGVQHELAAGAGRLLVTMEALTPNSYGAAALPLPMHSTSGAWKD